MLQLKLVRELPGVTVELLDKVVGRLVKWGVFDESLFSSTRVLSSTAIQKRYFSVARRRANIDTTYLLLDGVGVSADKNIVFDNNNSVSADKNGERKEKKSKENKIILRSNINEYKNDGYCWGNSDFDREVNNLRLPYTLESVLKAVNLIAENKYTEIEFI